MPPPPVPRLSADESAVYGKIHSAKEMGIAIYNLNQELRVKSMTNTLKSLQGKNLIKGIKTLNSKKPTHYVATKFEASSEITGGVLYTDGTLDRDFVDGIKLACQNAILNLKVATLETIAGTIKKMKISTVELREPEIERILNDLVLEDAVVKVTSTGIGEFNAIPVGRVCYKDNRKRGREDGNMAKIPCGDCAQISVCAPNGIVSPYTCVYYKEWMELLEF